MSYQLQLPPFSTSEMLPFNRQRSTDPEGRLNVALGPNRTRAHQPDTALLSFVRRAALPKCQWSSRGQRGHLMRDANSVGSRHEPLQGKQFGTGLKRTMPHAELAALRLPDER